MKKKLATVAILLLFLVGGYLISKQMYIQNKVYSHRGASGEEPEHSVSAYDLAVAYGSKFIEQDVVSSKDNTLFISHDKTAKRLTGQDVSYSDMTDTEIKKLRTEMGDPVLKLDDIFKLYKKKINYVIELKNNDQDVEKLLDLIKKNNLENRVVIQASTISSLDKVKEAYPDMPTLLLVKNQETVTLACDSESVDIVSIINLLMTKDNIKHIHESKKKVNVWTLNSIGEIKEAIELDVDSYFTNFTAKALVLEKKNFSINKLFK